LNTTLTLACIRASWGIVAPSADCIAVIAVLMMLYVVIKAL